jgi:hypothetical protein
MDALWRMALDNYQLVFTVLVIVLGLFAMALAVMLWRVAAQQGVPGDVAASRRRA